MDARRERGMLTGHTDPHVLAARLPEMEKLLPVAHRKKRTVASGAGLEPRVGSRSGVGESGLVGLPPCELLTHRVRRLLPRTTLVLTVAAEMMQTLKGKIAPAMGRRDG